MSIEILNVEGFMWTFSLLYMYPSLAKFREMYWETFCVIKNEILTFDKPSLFSILVFLIQGHTGSFMVRTFKYHAIFITLSQNAQDFRVHSSGTDMFLHK